MRARAVVPLAVLLCALPVLFLRAQGGSPHGPALQIDCGECHTSERWAPVDRTPTFGHESTGFPLVDNHARVRCVACHRSLVFNRVGTACADCHKDVHRGELGFRCEACHTVKTWTNQQEMFRVHNRTRFPLFAAHARVDCEACHGSQQPNQYVGTPTDCGTCHARTYEATRNPDHARAGFPRQCEGCHAVTSTTWAGATFRHDIFPLRGAHGRATCEQCHAGGRFRGTSRDCVSCHRPDYERALNPNHVAAGFPVECGSCHGENAWRPATFDHGRTRFPLLGAHAGLDCGRCHLDDRFAGTSTQCVSCHEAASQAARDPSHAGFPRQCESCHNVSAWRPATFDHDGAFFPINSGTHRGEWSSCAQCHPNPGNFRAFTCLSCHPHNDRERTDDKHRRVGGYRYDSQACYACHPRGSR